MSSFVNMMANDVWSEADIKARLHAEIRGEISEFAEVELNRALQGQMMGIHTLSQAESDLLLQFKGVVGKATALGVQARSDVVLLSMTLTYEAAVKRLVQDAVQEPGEGDATIADQDKYLTDASQREEAEATVASATENVVALCALRNPAVVSPLQSEAT